MDTKQETKRNLQTNLLLREENNILKYKIAICYPKIFNNFRMAISNMKGEHGICLDHIIDCILKGLNKQFGVMCCNILDLSITTCFIYFLLPVLGIKGYVLSIFFSEVLNFSISLFQLFKYSRIKPNLIDWIVVPLFCSLVGFFVVNIWRFNFVGLVGNLIFNVFLFVLVYGVTFFIVNLLNKKK